MLYVRIELWPQGNRLAARNLGEVIIGNVGGSLEIGEYSARISKFGGFKDPTDPKKKETWKAIRVKGFKRLSRGAWDLLLAVLATGLASRITKDLEAWDESETA